MLSSATLDIDIAGSTKESQVFFVVVCFSLLLFVFFWKETMHLTLSYHVIWAACHGLLPEYLSLLPEEYLRVPETRFEHIWFVWKVIPERTGEEVEMWDREEKNANMGTLMSFDSDQSHLVGFSGQSH